MITSLDRHTIRGINKDILEALRVVEQKYGVKITMGSTSYTSDNFSSKINVSIKKDGVVMSKEVKDFITYGKNMGIRKNLGDSFTFKDKKYVITGLKLTSPKYPVLAKDELDRTFKFTVDSINNR
jgi:hypothetical protein